MTSSENQPVKYRPAVTWWPIIVTAVMIIGAAIWILTIDTKFILHVAGFIGISALLFWLNYTRIYYIIVGDTLKINNPLGTCLSININRIRSVTVADLPFSGVSLSLRRIMINIEGGRGVQVSPLDRAGFIEHLKRINPRIIVGPGVLP